VRRFLNLYGMMRIIKIISNGPFDDSDPMGEYVLAMFFVVLITMKIISL